MSARFFHLPILLCGLGLTLATLRAEDVITTDGQTYSASALKRSGEMLMIKVTVAGGSGAMEMGLPVARIAKVKFVEPPELAKALAAAGKGNAAQVLDLTENYVTSQAEFKDLRGSWWLEMARPRLLALAASGKDVECAELARKIGSLKSPGAESLSRGGALFAPLASLDFQAVAVGVTGLPRLGGDQGSALAQLALGKALLLKKDYLAALKAFLTIKVFYPSTALLQPAALMGAADSYLGLKDQKHAAQSFGDIVRDWPDSAQAPEAKKKSADSTPS